MTRRTSDFQTIRSEGGLLPPDLLRRVLDPKEKLEGTRPEDYGLPQGERLNDVITQSWNRLRKHWSEFRAAVENLPASEAGAGLTNEKWSLPLLRELGFGLLPTSAGPEVGGRSYAINRFFGSVPIHLIGCRVDLDKRAAGVRGAAAANPHGLVQEFLNRSDAHDWAIVSNGLRLRILRDNQALSRQSFLECDLEAMFAGEIYADFVLLWLIIHATRFAPMEGDHDKTCLLEQWTKIADEQGARALGDLRGGVERSLQILGEGFTSHAKNIALRDALRSGKVTPVDFHGQLLRVVYRLIFLFVAEDRTIDGQPLLHPRDSSDTARIARERFSTNYGTGRLRELASKIKGSRHGDLWRQFQVLVGALSGNMALAAARAQLALPVLGSFLWAPTSTADLNYAELSNHDFLEALRHLAFTRQGKVLRPVDYKNLGAEELGGVYESLLALTPQISADGARFTFAEFAGNERKTSGSYYTPDSLVQCLLDSALDPIVEEAIKGKTGADAEKSILELKVCDPAVGSGHFLVGAAHRLARHLSRVRALAQGDSEPSPLLYQHALRDVIGRCLYGVDINPMAAELCRVSLWLEAMEPGKPLSFLDHHIRVGNSLLGAMPRLIAAGIPDEAFTPIEDDDRMACAVLKKRNKLERKGWGPLFVQQDTEMQDRLQHAASTLNELPDDRAEDIRAKELAFHRHEETEEYRHKKRLADAWCTAFVIKKDFSEPGREASAHGITQGHLNDLASGRPLPADLATETERISGQYGFFHWHLAFPEVFAKGGYDCILGNPPWERVNLREEEWFAERRPEIAGAMNAAVRKRLIALLQREEPLLYEEYYRAFRRSECEGHMLRHSGLYPLCGRGDINLYAVYGEAMRDLLGAAGLTGCVLPTGIATDDTTKFFFRDVVVKKSLVSLYSFENEEFIFPKVHHATRFCLFTVGSGLKPIANVADFVFFARRIDDLRDPERRFTLSAADIKRLNPNTQTCPIFRSRHDAELTKAIAVRIAPFVREGATDGNPWNVRFTRMLHMADDSHIFRTRDQLAEAGWKLSGNRFQKNGDECLPLYEAKMIHHFDHRWGTFEGQTQEQANQGKLPELDGTMHANPNLESIPRYWVARKDVEARINESWRRPWLLGFRDITGATVIRTVIATLLPRVPVGHTIPIIYPGDSFYSLTVLLQANLSTFCLDYCARQKVGGTHLTYGYLSQLPVLSPHSYLTCSGWLGSSTRRDWILPRALELTYTSWDLEPFAQDCGWSGPPFSWDQERRFLIRCELDAVFFQFYLPAEKNGDWSPAEGETAEDFARLKESFPTPRDAVVYIMETFPIVKRKDIGDYGNYRTKQVILKIYDAMTEAIRMGRSYQTIVNPLPGPPLDAIGKLSSMYLLDRSAWPENLHGLHPDWDQTLLNLWFVISQKRWTVVDDPQVFPWDGREAFVFALIPYLARHNPGESFEFYRDAALLASRAKSCEALLLEDELRRQYRDTMSGLDWLDFPETQRLRPEKIRERLQQKGIVVTDSASGLTTLSSQAILPPLPTELNPVLGLVIVAARHLESLRRNQLEHSRLEKLGSARNEIMEGVDSLMVS